MSRLLRAGHRIKKRRLLALMRASADDDRRVGERANQIDRERGLARRRIELQVPCDPYAIFRHTQLNKAFGIEFGPCSNRFNPGKSPSHGSLYLAVAGERAVRESTRRHNYRHGLSGTGRDPTRPQFRFDHDRKRRPRSSQCRLGQPRMIEWKQSHFPMRPLATENLTPGTRRRRGANRLFRRFQSFDEATSGLRFSDAGRVYPDRAFATGRDDINSSEPLP